MRMPSRFRFTVVALVALLLLVAGPTAFAAPDPPPTTYDITRSDCLGPLATGYNGSNPVVESLEVGGDLGLRCQSYGLDVYENNEYLTGPDAALAGCADIKFFRIYDDGEWLFLEWEQAGHPDDEELTHCHPTWVGSHQAAVEFDLDADQRGDVLLTGGTINCGHSGWVSASQDAGWVGFEDDTGSYPDDVGGTYPGTGASCSEPLASLSLPIYKDDLLNSGTTYPDENGDGEPDDGCSEQYPHPPGCQLGGNECDGYEQVKNPGQDDAYCQWENWEDPDGSGTGTKFRLAVRRTYLGLVECDTPPCEEPFPVRPWSDEQTSFGGPKMYEHDTLDPAHLNSDRRDNIPFFSGTTPVVLTAFAALPSTGTQIAIAVALLGLLAAGAAVLVLLPRYKKSRSG